jgi:hypothetical protein
LGKLTPLGIKPPACRCTLCAYTATLDADDRALLVSWLEDETIPGSVLSKHLAAQTPAVRLGSDAVLRWRRKETACRRG